MNPTTLQALKTFPEQLEAHYAAIADDYKHWAPASWDGIPSEHFTAIEQVCHVRDIEIEGYQLRIHRTLNEINPLLVSIDSESVALERSYCDENVVEVFSTFRQARTNTVTLIENLSDDQLDRSAVFEGYGPVTLRGLLHYLCSHDQQHLAGLQWLLGKIEATRINHEQHL
ncbi:MAG: DinB family protein [Arenimonas sp.]